MTTTDRTALSNEDLARKPWLAASEGTFWDISGVYDTGPNTFTHCLAHVVKAEFDDPPLFQMLTHNAFIDATWITAATEWVLVNPADRTESYYDSDGDR